MDGEIKAIIDGIQAEDNRQNHRIDALEGEVRNIHDIASSIKELTLEIKHLREDVQSQSARLDKIENAPLNRLEGAKATAIGTIVSAVIGAIIGAIIMTLKNGG